MNYAHVAYYANLILQRFGYETEPVAFWREYHSVITSPKVILCLLIGSNPTN